MIFIETSVFTRQVTELLPDEDFREMQNFLVKQPTAGDVIQETGGARKLRWRRPGMGKRGGVRTIYYYAVAEDQIWLLLMYPKAASDDLSADQKKQLKKIVEAWSKPL